MDAQKVQVDTVAKAPTSTAIRATVIEVIGKTGSRGGITQVKVQLVNDKRTLIRNVMGPVRKGDTLELMECEREARRLR